MKGDHIGNGVISCIVLYCTVLYSVQYCREDADLKKKDHQDRTKNASCEVSKFPKFCQKFYPIFRVLLFVGVKIKGEKSFQTKNLGGGEFFWVDFFLFFENIFGDHFHISQFVPI